MRRDEALKHLQAIEQAVDVAYKSAIKQLDKLYEAVACDEIEDYELPEKAPDGHQYRYVGGVIRGGLGATADIKVKVEDYGR